MNLSYSEGVQQWLKRLNTFMDTHIYPVEHQYHRELNTAESRWDTPALMSQLKEQAKADGLWNLFIPPSLSKFGGAGLTNLAYAPLAEQMGRVLWSPEVFNCNAPDTGNMEVFMKYATEQQQEAWLKPLLAGKIRSSYAMTERHVASSDATNIECLIEEKDDHFLINGHKWFITGVMHNKCEILIVMGKSEPNNPNRHQQQSQILVPKNTPGVKVIRPLTTMGYDDAPLGHGEVIFDNVKVPKENLLLGLGRGFEIAQGRLGPGRIHHCMRLIGAAQRALEFACSRAQQRHTFGKPMAKHQSVREVIASSFAQIEQARLLTLKTADQIDRFGAKAARDYIAAAKISVPVMAQKVIDSAIQIHGAGGLSDDWFMAEAFNYARWCRLADGPDEVHMMSLGKQIIERNGVRTNE
jgi:acyl-CoA dehydrogenase